MTLAVDVPPAPLGRLTPELLEEVPRTFGLYTAWIGDAAAAEQAGIDRTAPFPVYVGIAKDLRGRLSTHAPMGRALRLPFTDLAEMLAARGVIGWGLWHRSLDKGPGYWNRPSALGQVFLDAALAWQDRHLQWGWQPLPEAQARAAETRLIAEQVPVLNKRGRGLKAKPPLLRDVGRYEEARAFRLWLLSAIGAVLTGAPRRDDLDPWRPRRRIGRPGIESYDFDQIGYITAPGEGTARQLVQFDPQRTLTWLRSAASAIGEASLIAALQHAKRRPNETGPGVTEGELVLWFAAAWLMNPAGRPEEGLEYLLTPRSDRGSHWPLAPRRLPPQERLPSLLDLVAALSDERK